MTRPRQKREELQLVELLRRALSGEPDGHADSANEPDVIVTTPAGRLVGIEVTELHQASVPGRPPKRLQESERAAVLAHARRLAEASGMPVVDVAVHFNDSVAITKRDRERIANELVALVSVHVPIDDLPIEVDLFRHRNHFLPWIRLVRVFRASFLTKHHWAAPDSGWVQMEFSAELQNAIDEKNARFACYRKNCDECWLLIAASGGRPSGLFEASDATRNHLYRSPFARTFFLEAFVGTVIELRTTPS
jgi:hypothetical protein